MIEFQNHAHMCELRMLRGKYLKKYCPFKFRDDFHDECDECEHLRIVRLNDEGTKITEIV